MKIRLNYKKLLSLIDPNINEFEIVERKFRGHPDSLADMVAQRFSQLYIQTTWKMFPELENKIFPNFSADKVTLSGASTLITPNGYEVIKPIDALLIGKITQCIGETKINVQKIFEQSIHDIFKKALNCADYKDFLRTTLYTVQQAGVDHKFSFYNPQTLKDLTEIIKNESVANDTVFVVAYAPLTATENLTIYLDNLTAGKDFRDKFPQLGSDIKSIVCRKNTHFNITMCLPYIPTCGVNNYEYEKTLKEATDYLNDKIYEKLRENYIGKNIKIVLKTNTKDTKDKKYYAILGTSLSKGNIGAVGRGNRQQGFISGIRPSTNEAFSGKNPNHFSGVVYQSLAENIAKAIYSNTGIKNIVYIMANNGDRLEKPQSIDVFLEKRVLNDRIKEIIEEELENIEQNKFLFVHKDIYNTFMGNT